MTANHTKHIPITSHGISFSLSWFVCAFRLRWISISFLVKNVNCLRRFDCVSSWVRRHCDEMNVKMRSQRNVFVHIFWYTLTKLAQYDSFRLYILFLFFFFLSLFCMESDRHLLACMQTSSTILTIVRIDAVPCVCSCLDSICMIAFLFCRIFPFGKKNELNIKLCVIACVLRVSRVRFTFFFYVAVSNSICSIRSKSQFWFMFMQTKENIHNSLRQKRIETIIQLTMKMCTRLENGKNIYGKSKV